MKLYANAITLVALVAATSLVGLTSALLVQPYNYMLDDSSMVGSQHQDSGSLSPFYNDQSGASESQADKDIISILGDGLARLRFARMLNNHNQEDQSGQHQGHLSQEMAELLQNEQQQQASSGKQDGQEPSSVVSSVSSAFMDVINAAAQAAAPSNSGDDQNESSQSSGSQSGSDSSMSSRGSIMELDTSSSSATSMPSKADVKHGPRQWFNPKETYPVLKISSMATPSKYKKVYFRSEKKLVDGAFHSLPNSDQDEKKSLMKPFNSGVQRRSSRGTSQSVAPQGMLQDGFIDFLKKFRDVYIQTRPVSTASGSGSSGSSSFASSMMSAAASSPLAAVLAPPSGGSRPNLASALSMATSMVNQAAAAASFSPSSASNPSGAGGSLAVSSTAAGSSSSGAAGSPIRSPLTAQSYVSFWSKTFPTWVRKMLKQMRRRSLHNSSKRNQQHKHHSSSSTLGQAAQAAASGAAASVADSSSSSGSSGSSSS